MTTPKLGLHTTEYSAQGWDAILSADMEILDDAVVVEGVAEGDFIVTGADPFPWEKKTLAETKSILGIPTGTAEGDFISAGADPFAWAKKTKAEAAAILKDQFPQAITDNHVVTVDSADAGDDEYARFTAAGLEGRTTAEVLADVGKLDPAVAADTFSGITASFEAGETVAVAHLVYFKTPGEIWKADMNAAATMPGMGIVTQAKNDGEACIVLLYGIAHLHTLAPSWTVGGLVYAGAAGALSQSAPSGNEDMVQIVGIAIAADVLLFNPQYTMVEVTA